MRREPGLSCGISFSPKRFWKEYDGGMRIFLLFPALAFFALRTTVVPLRVSEIQKKSELIFVGVAGKGEARFEDGKKTIRTYVPFRVLKVLKGNAPGKDFKLRLEGGQVGKDILRIPGMPKFIEGRTYLCFVRGNGKNLSPITGFWQGLLEIRTLGKRQVLVNQKGLELIGVKDDRFVFALPKAKVSKAPPAKKAPSGVKPAHPDVERLERELPRPRVPEKAPAEPQKGPKPKLHPATPIYVPANRDRGIRMSLDAFLKGME